MSEHTKIYSLANEKWLVLAKIWLVTLRPKTLSASVAPILVGVSLSYAAGYPIKGWIVLFTLLSALCIQSATNLINDTWDFKTGADSPNRLGPKRGLQLGLISTSQMWKAIYICWFLTFLFGMPLALKGGWPIVAVLFISVLNTYLYTGGPFPLAYYGWGDLFSFLFFGLVITCSTYYLQTGQLDTGAWIAGIQMGALSTVLIAINNLRDVHNDAKVNKNTLAVRFGILFSRLEITCLLYLTFILNVYWLNVYWSAGWGYIGLLPMILMPLTAKIIRSVWRTEPSSAYNAFLALAGLLQLAFGILLSAVFWIVSR